MELKINDTVEVLDTGKWRTTRILKYKPYFHRLVKFDGYEVLFLTNTKICKISNILPSQGGWKSINSIRKIKQKQGESI